MSSLKPYADLKYKARTYKDESGKEKGVWVTIGTMFSSPHGSNQAIKLDTIPVGEWNGWVSIYVRDDWKGQQRDVVPEADTDKPITLDDVEL